jgi:hypothetical protein
MCIETMVTVTPPPSTAAASSNVQAEGDGDAMNLTKNQKKKRRKRKTKETSEAKAEATPSLAAPRISGGVNAAPLNPSALVHAQLMAEGFNPKDIELAMGEMWDKEMTGYDEFEAVLAYLKDKNGSKQHKPQAQDEPTSDMSSSKESTEPSMNEHAHEEVLFHHVDLGEKLDLVSDNDDLADAAFALSEWISKAAQPSDVRNRQSLKEVALLSSFFYSHSFSCFIRRLRTFALSESQGLSLPSLDELLKNLRSLALRNAFQLSSAWLAAYSIGLEWIRPPRGK